MQQPMPGQDPWALVADLRRRVEELERRSLTNAVVTDGRLEVRDGAEFTVRHMDGGWVFHVGVNSDGKYFSSLRRDDGTAALELGTTGAGHQFLAIWDRSGRIVVSDDATAGAGLARPWIPVSAGVPVLSTSIPMTSSASYVATWSAGFPTKQQPYLGLNALLRSESGATGNARFTVNGSVIGSVMAIAANGFGWAALQTVEIPTSIAWDAEIQVELQVQRTNAVGTVGGVFQGYQRQSP